MKKSVCVFLLSKHTLFQKPGASTESRHCGQDKRIFFYRFVIRCITKQEVKNIF